MNESWKQIWFDIVNSIRGQDAPSREPEPPKAAKLETTGAAEAASVLDVPADAASPRAATETAQIQDTATLTQSEPRSEETVAFAEPRLEGELAARFTPQEEPEPELSDAADSGAEDLEGEPIVVDAPGATWRQRVMPILGVIVLGLLAIVYLAWPQLAPTVDALLEPQPPAPDVVATFKDGQITRDQMQAHLDLLVPKEQQDAVRSLGNLRALASEMVVDELIRRWAAERKVDSEETFSHTMQHITENLNLDSLHAQLHTQDIPVQESEIQAYYQANAAQFEGRTLDDAREEIRNALASQKEGSYIQEYIARLKANGSITQDLALLKTPEPTEDELKQYYETNRAKFQLPAQAVVDEIQISIDDDETASRQRADAVLLKLQSGATFPDAARTITDTVVLTATTMISGTRSAAWMQQVQTLQPNELSGVIRDEDEEQFSIVRLKEWQPERVASFAQVRSQALATVRAQKADEWFKSNADKTLFTLKGKRYTLGQFYQEYQELSPEVSAQFQGEGGLEKLASQVIERLLLVEDSYDRLLDSQNKAELDETRLDVLKQMYEQESVDDKIKITDEEIQKFYDENQAQLIPPPQARVRYIRIGLGQTADEEKRAQEKANEAYQKLAPGPFQQGADFAALASEYSEDPESAAKGGELDGWVGEGFDTVTELLDHPFHQAVLELPVNGISRPFLYGESLYIVQVLERRESKQIDLEQAKPLIESELRHRKHDELAKQLSDRLIQENNLVVYDLALRAMLPTPEAELTPEE